MDGLSPAEYSSETQKATLVAIVTIATAAIIVSKHYKTLSPPKLRSKLGLAYSIHSQGGRYARNLYATSQQHGTQKEKENLSQFHDVIPNLGLYLPDE
ncbi:hypothetical protein NDU88_007339 [Pleurodeles waltl]|uniref:Uncharacterized protein n=1 Tax=Pleurodeles waltl TaxID=8319 RepID=A0AAV7U184_PLEWA|nr:hypothetical protein NDU88_007339 [Pleurodeles waltl]